LLKSKTGIKSVRRNWKRWRAC